MGDASWEENYKRFSLQLRLYFECVASVSDSGPPLTCNRRPVGCALGMKFESCDWCPAPPSSNGFLAALVFEGELPNGFLFEIAAGFIHRKNRLHRRFSFEI